MSIDLEPVGDLAALNFPDYVTNFYQYDALSRLTNVLGRDSVSAGYTFDGVGNLQTVRYANGVTNLYQYDRLNRLTNAVWKQASTTVGSFFYRLNLSGARTNLSETLNGSRTYVWQYDSLYRLTNENISAVGALSYRYDGVGNRTNRTSSVSGLANQTPTYNTNDWLNSDSYDDNGNTTGSGGNAYQYDVLNRLTNVNSGAIVIGYDGDGNRVSKKVGGVTTYYLVDDRNPTGYAQVLEEYESSTLTAVYTHGLDLISQRRSGTVSYYIYDGHGSVRALTGTGGTVTDTYQYDAYGNKLSTSTGTTANNYLYTGEQFDSDLNFYYLRARYLNPNTGRFWTMDTFQGRNSDPLSLHKYLYAHANPGMMIDPSGHFSLGEINITTAIRLTLFTLNVAGAISNSKQTARYSVAAFQAIADDDPWNATLAIAGATMHGGLTVLNVLGVKSFMSSIGPPPAGGFAVVGGGTVVVGRVWQIAFSNPAARKWIFEEFVPVVGTGLGLFVSHSGHQAEWEHRDPEGKIKTRGNSESGSDVPPGRRLNWNEQLRTHTEYKILAELSGTTKPGDIITIRGTLAPCNPGGRGCQEVMDEFARLNQVKIIYKAENKVWTFQ